MKKGGPLIPLLNLSIFLSTFIFKISTAIDLEFHVANSFSNEESIQLKFKREGTSQDVWKLAHGEELQSSFPVTEYLPRMKLECEVSICVGNVEFLLDSFVLFKFRWTEKKLQELEKEDKLIYYWDLNEEGAFLSPLSSHPENQELMHKWNNMILIFTMTNRFSGKEDIILSIHATDSKSHPADIFVSQEKIGYGEKHIGHYGTDRVYRPHISFRCFYDRVLEGVRRYVGFFEINYSRQQGGSGATIAVRKFEYILDEGGATMLVPSHTKITN